MRNLTICLLLFLLPAVLTAQEAEVPALIINEIQVANIDQYLDEAKCYGGWIELYNPSDTTISLRSMWLVSGDNEYRILGSLGSVPAGGYKVLWFGHSQSEGNYGTGARFQIPFKLETEGGEISLQTSDRTVVSSAAYPPAIARCSWARTTDGGEDWSYTGEPSPGASNNGSDFAEFRLEAPTVDGDSRVFDDDFTVSIDIPNGYTLRYTTDGSAPTATNGETSTSGRFPISATTIMRFCFLCQGYLPSPVVTRSYIRRNHAYYLPILSVASEPKNFFDNKVGVFVKGSGGISGNGQSSACNWNMDWERPVNMEYLVPVSDTNGSVAYAEVLNQEMDLEICGGWTRAYGGATVDGKHWEARSSFRLKTDKRYEGVGEIAYPVFPSKPYNKYRCWQVRNGGNDTYARTKDPALQMMVMRSGFYVDCQDYQPAHVFLNGQYYGMLNIRESNNKHYGYSNYGIDFDDMDQFDLSSSTYNQKVGDNKAWQQLLTLSKRLASSTADESYRQMCDLLDMDEYVNYMALECYLGPSDWITNTNNVKAFRSRSDGKFHFVLFDLDSAFGTSNMLRDVLNTSGGSTVDDLFRALMRYDPFRRQFLDAFCIVNGSVLEPSRCEPIVREIYENINPALSFEGSSSNLNLIGSINSAHNGSRINNLRSYYGTTYGIQANLSANIPEARISVNGQEIPTGRFDGYLFSYKNEPVTIAAKAPAGYVFDGWLSESATPSTTTLIPEGSDWDFFDTGSMDGIDWKDVSFDASANGWTAGTAPFGFSLPGYDMQENAATLLNPSTGGRRSTYYFRKTFSLDAPLAQDDILTFSYQIDDGLMIYVNGHEVESYFVQSGSAYADYTSDGHYEALEPHIGSVDIPHEYLLDGKNVIAVEAKNCSPNSVDMWFEGSLSVSAKQRELFCQESDVDLHEKLSGGSQIVLKALFSPIASERQRWEAGASPLRINEVNAVGDVHINDYGKKADWLELYNTTDEDIPLEGLYLSDDSSNPQKFRLQEGIVPAHGTRIVWCDNKASIDQLHAPFKLENADGAMVSIQASDGSWADKMLYQEHDKWQSFGRYPDGGNMATVLNQPTIDKSNRLGMHDFNALSEEDWLGNDRTITIDLAEGWNWTSHNLAEGVDRSRFLTDALCLKGQEENLLFAEDGWRGDLQSLESAKGYKIQMQQAGSVTLRGNLFDTNRPVTLNAGWNWLGCPLFNATTLESALGDYVPNDGDRVVSFDAFATYEDGKWHGSLRTFQPGQAYLFFARRPSSFRWRSLSPFPRKRSKRYAAEETATSPAILSSFHSYPDVMTMVATVEIDEEISPEVPYYIGAFAGDTCRGTGFVQDGLLYMNIHGDENCNLTFRLLTPDGDEYRSVSNATYQSGKQLGTVSKPCQLTFKAQDIVDEIVPKDETPAEIRAVIYYNLSGQRIAKPASGLCIRRTIYANGTEKSEKVRTSQTRP